MMREEKGDAVKAKNDVKISERYLEQETFTCPTMLVPYDKSAQCQYVQYLWFCHKSCLLKKKDKSIKHIGL